MRLVADESVEGPTVTALRAAGYTVLFIAETSPGIEDAQVLEIARREQALLLTADKDFGELVFRNREPHCGVLLIRAPEDDPDENAANTLAAVRHHGPALLESVFCSRTRRPADQNYTPVVRQQEANSRRASFHLGLQRSSHQRL